MPLVIKLANGSCLIAYPQHFQLMSLPARARVKKIPRYGQLVLEDGKAVLYGCNENSHVYHEVPLSPMEFEVDDGPALEQLITTVEPLWIHV
jgi:hypothetical protein